MTSRRQRTEAVRTLARASRLLERASGDLSLAQYRILAAVRDGDERATRVAARLALGKPTVSAAVDGLCRRGLLIREDVAEDQRAAALRLTDAGSALLGDVEAAMVARLDTVLVHADDPAGLVRGLAQLGAALDALAASRTTERAGMR